MYTSKVMTKPDGTKYIQLTRVEPDPVFTEDQLIIQKAIEDFGTSA